MSLRYTIDKRTTFILFIIICLYFVSAKPALAISGHVWNNFGKRIDSARVTIINSRDSSDSYVTYTDSNGYYNVSLKELLLRDSKARKIVLYKHYPNPFNQQLTFPIVLLEKGHLNIDVYDFKGRHITSVVNNDYPDGIYNFQWNGRDKNGELLKQGLYFYRVVFEGEIFTGKIVRINKVSNAVGTAPLPIKKFDVDSFYLNYHIRVEKDGYEDAVKRYVVARDVDSLNFLLFIKSDLPYKCVGNYFGVWDGSKYRKIFIKGINLGVAKPGTQPGEMAATTDDYHRWINRMGELGINSIRAYTLHFPRFYAVLDSFNTANPTHPIYLFQGIWLNEYENNNNFYNLSHEFDTDIEEVVDCVHGNRKINERPGRAYGNYTTNVSKWVMGYIIGREIHPREVIPTDSINHAVHGYQGVRIRIDTASPTEAWITARLDHLVDYEKSTYGIGRPFSFSSWPTMDPIQHPTEKKNFTDEDTTQFDLENINTFDAPGGYFASFHAYPYYPDFVSEDSIYRLSQDSVGFNSYLGYLKDLKSHYHDRPLLIAEYGTPSSLGSAHFSHSGMNHGGLDEKTQGYNDARLISNIYEDSCAGGMLFAWIDEWFKITWITNPIGTVPARRHFWHNLCSPEQNFGLITFDPPKPDFKPLQFFNTNCLIDTIKWAIDWQYLRVRINLKQPFLSSDTMLLAFDTYKSDVGEKYLPNGHPVSTRPEFTLQITSADHADLYVTQAYDLFEIWFTGWADPKQLFHTTITDGAPWNLVRWRNDENADAIDSLGKLRVRWPGEDTTSLDCVFVNSDVVEVRIPWTLLNFVDPSQLEVMNDNRLTPERETGFTDGVTVGVYFRGCFNQAEKFTWDPWDAADGIEYTEREKPAMKIFSDKIKDMPYWVK